MSLLDETSEEFVILSKTTVSDGYGGYTVEWRDGATIKGNMAFNSSLEAQKAQAQGVYSVYTLLTKRDIVLEYHDVLRRVRDGKIFRVKSDGDDSFTPPSASLDLRRVDCEEWTLSGEWIPPEVTNG